MPDTTDLGERTLWTAVLEQAVLDAPHDSPEGADARDFLRSRARLEPLCAALDLNVEWVQRKLAQAYPWLRDEAARGDTSSNLANYRQRHEARAWTGGRATYWTQAQILTTVQAWTQRQGRLPETGDFSDAQGLPAFSTMWRTFGTLKALYALLRETEDA